MNCASLLSQYLHRQTTLPDMLQLLLLLAGLIVVAPQPGHAQFTLGPDVAASGHTVASGGSFSLRGTVGQPAASTSSGDSYAHGTGFWYAAVGSSGSGAIAVYANLRAFLEGPYSGSDQMTTDLNSGSYLPTSQPYDAAPWNYSGTESVSSLPSGVVDWVLVELRTGDPTSPPMTVEAQRAAFLTSDGTLVDTDGTNEISFSDLPDDPYYVTVIHRNHLAVMSSSALALGASDGPAGAPYDYDFTTGQSQAYTTGTDPMQNLGDGNTGLIAGNANTDETTNFFNIFAGDDRTAVLDALGGDPAATLSGYHRADVTMDGTVNFFNIFAGDDRTAILDVLGGDPAAEITSQVPDP